MVVVLSEFFTSFVPSLSSIWCDMLTRGLLAVLLAASVLAFGCFVGCLFGHLGNALDDLAMV